MIVFPNAKINLGLNILSKRLDGYHNISSIFYPCSKIYDILEIIPSDHFLFSSTGISIPDGINICTRAFDLLKADFNINNVKIHLHKQIPIGAGLGGGSADGSFTLVLLDKLFNLKLSDIQLRSYALRLGADCPFFIENTPQYVRGVGEKMTPINLDLSDYEIRFIFPKLHISTADAYNHIIANNSCLDLLELPDIPIKYWRKILINDFENYIFSKHPELDLIKQKFYSQGAVYSSMTGSGSAIYGIFKK